MCVFYRQLLSHRPTLPWVAVVSSPIAPAVSISSHYLIPSSRLLLIRVEYHDRTRQVLYDSTRAKPRTSQNLDVSTESFEACAPSSTIRSCLELLSGTTTEKETEIRRPRPQIKALWVICSDLSLHFRSSPTGSSR